MAVWIHRSTEITVTPHAVTQGTNEGDAKGVAGLVYLALHTALDPVLNFKSVASTVAASSGWEMGVLTWLLPVNGHF